MFGKRRIFIWLFFIGILLFLSSGCTMVSEKQADDDNWQDDIVYAKKCGLDGLPCCPKEKGLPCQYGQICCTDQNDPSRNKCVDECSYGSENDYCRLDDPKCDSGLTCFNGDCVVCGGPDQPCCGDEPEKCEGGLICFNNMCRQCGLVGNPCCAGEEACAGEKSRDNDRAECFDGVCQNCGSNRKQVCREDPLCNIGNIQNGNLCLACGGFNQPCCNKTSGVEYKCKPNSGLTCDLGFCGK